MYRLLASLTQQQQQQQQQPTTTERNNGTPLATGSRINTLNTTISLLSTRYEYVLYIENIASVLHTIMLLTDEQLKFFIENGYILIKRILHQTKCKQFDEQIVQPALEKYGIGDIHLNDNDKRTWNSSSNSSSDSSSSSSSSSSSPITERLISMATGDYDLDKPHILPGVMIRKENGENPISDRDSDTLGLDVLNPILDQLHCRSRSRSRSRLGNKSVANSSEDAGTEKDWEWLHKNVGWIHVRFPPHVDSDSIESVDVDSDGANVPTSHKEYTHKHTRSTFHIDGGHFSPHFLDSPEQSVVIIPMIRPVEIGGGNTVILKKSHVYMAQQLAKAARNGNGIPREETQNCNNIANVWPRDLIVEVAPCEAGDVLIMHPFLVHAAGRVRNCDSTLRIAFNMGVRWNNNMSAGTDVRNYLIVHDTIGTSLEEGGDGQEEGGGQEVYLSWMEKSIAWALKQSTSFMEDTCTVQVDAV